jgi:hypothetical protein
MEAQEAVARLPRSRRNLWAWRHANRRHATRQTQSDAIRARDREVAKSRSDRRVAGVATCDMADRLAAAELSPTTHPLASLSSAGDAGEVRCRCESQSRTKPLCRGAGVDSAAFAAALAARHAHVGDVLSLALRHRPRVASPGAAFLAAAPTGGSGGETVPADVARCDGGQGGGGGGGAMAAHLGAASRRNMRLSAAQHRVRRMEAAALTHGDTLVALAWLLQAAVDGSAPPATPTASTSGGSAFALPPLDDRSGAAGGGFSIEAARIDYERARLAIAAASAAVPPRPGAPSLADKLADALSATMFTKVRRAASCNRGGGGG